MAESPRIPKYVLPGAAVKDSLSWKGGKLGYAGIAMQTVGNLVTNINENKSGAKIAGDAVVDVGSAWEPWSLPQRQALKPAR